jgi:hypothetical protein
LLPSLHLVLSPLCLANHSCGLPLFILLHLVSLQLDREDSAGV